MQLITIKFKATIIQFLITPNFLAVTGYVLDFYETYLKGI